MVSKQTSIINATGLHARPASVFVTEAKKYQCNVTIKNVDKDSPSRTSTRTPLPSTPSPS